MYLVIFGSAMEEPSPHPAALVQEVPPYNDTPLFTSAAYQLNDIGQADDANKMLDVTVYADEAAAKQDLDNGKLSAVIVFPSSVSNDNAVRVYVDSSDSVTPPLIEAAVNHVMLGLGAQNPIIVDNILTGISCISSSLAWVLL